MLKLKDVLFGAVAQIIPKTISHLANVYMVFGPGGITEAEKRAKYSWWYGKPIDTLPPIDDWVLDLGLPALLFLGSQLSPLKYKETLKNMSIGAGLTGGAIFLHSVLSESYKWVPTA